MQKKDAIIVAVAVTLWIAAMIGGGIGFAIYADHYNHKQAQSFMENEKKVVEKYAKNLFYTSCMKNLSAESCNDIDVTVAPEQSWQDAYDEELLIKWTGEAHSHDNKYSANAVLYNDQDGPYDSSYYDNYVQSKIKSDTLEPRAR